MASKKLFLIYSTKRINRLISKNNNPNSTFVFFDPQKKDSTIRGFKDTKLVARLLSASDFRIDGLKEVNRHSQQLFDRISKLGIKGKTLKDSLIFENIPLWQIQLNELRIFIRNQLKSICEIESIIKQTKPDHVTICFESPVYYGEANRPSGPDIALCVCRSRRIHFKQTRPFPDMNRYFQPIFSKAADAVFMTKQFARGLGKRKLTEYREYRPKTLFFHYAANGIKTSKPVHDELKKRGHDVLAISLDGIRSDPTSRALQEAEMNFIKFGMFDSKRYRRQADSKRRYYKRLGKNLIKSRKFGSIFIYRNIDFFPAMERFLNYQFRKKLYYNARTINILQQIIKHVRPESVSVINSVTDFGMSACLAARTLGVPSITIQHGGIGDIYGFVPVSSDRIAVWSNTDKRKLVSAGVPEKKILVTGNPDYQKMLEEIRTNKDYDKKNILKSLGIKNGRKIALFAAKYPVTNYLADIKKILKILDEADYYILIKLHPGEHSITPEELADTLLIDRKQILQQENFYKILVISDLLVTSVDSTVTADAAMFGLKAINLGFENTINDTVYDIGYHSEGIALYAKNLPSLRPVLEKLKDSKIVKMLSENQKNFLRENTFPRGKDPLSCIAAAIEEITSKGKNR